jgi:hypothetical protein
MHSRRFRIAPFALLLACAVHGQDRNGSTLQTVITDGSAANAAVTQYLVALPHFAYGGQWRTQFVIGNSSSDAATVTLYYLGDTGAALSVSYNGVSSTSTTLTIPANGQTVIEPDYSALTDSVGGWAGIQYTNSGIKVQGVILWHKTGDPADQYHQAAAPIISQVPAACIIPLPSTASGYTLPFDETNGRFSGFGFANTTNAVSTLNVTLYDSSGTQLGQYTQQLNPFGHTAFLVRDKIAPAEFGGGKRGIMSVSGTGIVPLGFMFTSYYAFATWQP